MLGDQPAVPFRASGNVGAEPVHHARELHGVLPSRNHEGTKRYEDRLVQEVPRKELFVSS
jgi:hypothetical protein